MVLDDDVDAVRIGELTQASQTVRGQLLLLLEVEHRVAARVHAYRMAAEIPRRLHPLVVIGDRGGTCRLVPVAEFAFIVAHDEEALNALAVGARFHLAQVALLARLVEEECVDVLDAAEAVVPLGDGGEVEVLHFAGSEGSMERPLGEGDRIEGPRLRSCQPGGCHQ